MYNGTGADSPATMATAIPRWRIHLLPLLFLYFNSPATSLSAEKNPASPPLKIGFTDLPPISVVNDIDPIGGSSATFLRNLLSLIGCNFSFVGYPMKRLKASLENGATNIWFGPKEVENVLYGEKSIFSLGLSVFSAKHSPLLNQLSDLNGRHIIAVAGHQYGGVGAYVFDPKNKIKIEEAWTHDAAFKMLIQGRGDYLLAYTAPINLSAKKLNLERELRWMELAQIDFFFMVNKNTPNADSVLQQLTNASSTVVQI